MALNEQTSTNLGLAGKFLVENIPNGVFSKDVEQLKTNLAEFMAEPWERSFEFYDTEERANRNWSDRLGRIHLTIKSDHRVDDSTGDLVRIQSIFAAVTESAF